MDTDFLDLKIGSKTRTVTIKEINKITIRIEKDDRSSDKVQFLVCDVHTGNTFRISDCWIEDAKGAKSVKGLWLTLANDGNEVSSGSALGKLLAYYETKSLRDLIGKQVKVYPDYQDFLVLTACDMPQDIANPKPEEQETDHKSALFN